MRYWWVNQNQTHRQEIGGGYMWSPKHSSGKDGRRIYNRFYDNMRTVEPGDLVFSFVDTRIFAIGVVKSLGYDCPRPDEFGSKGMQWDAKGWRVEVNFITLKNKIRPKDHIQRLKSFLPDKYSPLTTEGNGLQGVYLASVPDAMATALGDIIGEEATSLMRMICRDEADMEFILPLEAKKKWDDHEEESIVKASDIGETQKKALVNSRRGQGVFRESLCHIEHRCRVTHIANPKYLIASHIKPWRHSDNQQRLDGENGLLLCPNIDLLFDRGLISFEDSGDLIASPVVDENVMEKMQAEVGMNVGDFTTGQQTYLNYHRENILLKVG